MKNYRFLIPLMLIVLFMVSFYMLYDAKASAIIQYNELLSEARTHREKGVYVDAETAYKSVLELKPTLDIYIELGELYLETNQNKRALDWAEVIVEKYPKEVAGYEFQMGLLSDLNDYAACFRLADTFEKRGLTSAKIDAYIAKIEYQFYFNGEYSDVGIYSGGLCPVMVGTRWGYVDTQGKRVVSCVYASVGAFSGGLSPVIDRDGQVYYIDTNGNKKFVIQGIETVTALGLIEAGIYALHNGESWGFYNEEYKHLFGEYQEVSAIGNGVAAVKKEDNWSFVDRSGKDLTGKTYAYVAMDEKMVVYRNGRMFVSGGDGYQMIDIQGNQIGTMTFQSAHIFNDTTYAAVMVDGLWGFVNTSGEMVIAPAYEDARSFTNGYAAVKKDGRWGFIDLNGNMVIEPQFKNAKDFNNHGCVFVIVEEAWELLRLYKYNF